jgi:hypothetical protein
MGIRDISPENFVAPYKRPRFGSGEAEEAWKQRQADRRAVQTVLAAVAEGCSVETVGGAMLRDGEEVTPADVGGGVNLDRLASVGAVNKVTENEAKSSRGEFEFKFKKAVTHNGKIWDENESFNAPELDVPAEEPVQRIDGQGRVVMTQGRPAVVGAELTEQLIKRGLVERARLRDAVVAKAKKLLKGEKAKAAKSGG